MRPDSAESRSLVSWGIDPRSDTVQVGLTSVSRQLAASAAATFGERVSLMREQRPSFSLSRSTRVSRLVHVSQARLAKIEMMAGRVRNAGAGPAVAPQPSRLLDTQPYFGGDRIGATVSVSGGGYLVTECTAGFMWTAPAMSTAGHCGGTGTVWYQGYVDTSTSPATFYYTGTMGTQYSTQWGNGRIDFALMNGTGYGPWVYTGLTTGNPVDGWFTPYVDQPVCTDGSFTLENCNAQVASVGRCVTYPQSGVDTCGLDFVVSTNGSTIVQSGDSGGPVYWYDGNTIDGYPAVNASGTISGQVGSTTALVTDINLAISTMNDGTVAAQS